jgi:hypothetical protein
MVFDINSNFFLRKQLNPDVYPRKMIMAMIDDDVT